jgi:hypothetical protein
MATTSLIIINESTALIILTTEHDSEQIIWSREFPNSWTTGHQWFARKMSSRLLSSSRARYFMYEEINA